jgi:hypothetical protein
VARALREHNISYPVLLDNDNRNWNRWRQRYWPTVYLLDRRGGVRHKWEGELKYNRAGGEARLAALMDELLKEMG